MIAASAVMWGCIGLFVRRLSSLGLGSMQLVAVRSVITFAAMLIYMLIFDRRGLYVRFRDLWCFAGTGICSVVFFNFCYFKAINLSSLSAAAVLLYTSPVFVMILSALLFKERITPRKIISLASAFGGCVLVSGIIGGGNALSVSALMYGLGAGFGYALYSIFGTFALRRGYSSVTVTLYTFLFASAGSAAVTDFSPVFDYISASGAGGAVFIVIFAFVSTVIPYLLYTFGLSRVEAGRAAIIASIEPVVATVIGAAVFNEIPDIWGFTGIVMVLISMIILNMKTKSA